MPSGKKTTKAAGNATNLEEIVQRVMDESLGSQAFVAQIVSAVAERVTQIVVKELESSLKFNSDLVHDLKSELNRRSDEIEQLRRDLNIRCDDLEQYGRRNNLRIFGVPEGVREDIDNVVLSEIKKVNVDLEICDIDRCHRVGYKTDSKARPIIVKFTSYRKRQQVFNNKKFLKGSGITIREDLTAVRLSILKAAITKYGLRSVWTSDGATLIRLPDGNKLRVTRLDELPRN